MTDEELRKLLASNPDIAIAGSPGRLDSAQGAKVDSQYTKAPESRLERKFINLWESLGCPALKPQHKFDEVRKWRFDFAHLGSMVAVELEGVLYRKNRQGQTVSRHQHPKGYEDDCEKYNVATLGGWQVYRLTANMITAEWCNRIADAIRTTEEMSR